jgi:hypothetical protein
LAEHLQRDGRTNARGALLSGEEHFAHPAAREPPKEGVAADVVTDFEHAGGPVSDRPRIISSVRVSQPKLRDCASFSK